MGSILNIKKTNMLRRITRAAAIAFCFSLTSGYAQPAAMPYSYGSEAVSAAKEMFDNGLIRKAEQRLLGLAAAFPDGPSLDRAVFTESDIDLISGNYSVAEGRLQEFISIRPNSPFVPFAKLQLGYLAFQHEMYEKAETYFKDARKSADEDLAARGDRDYAELAHAALFWRAVAMCNQGKYQDAAPVFEECAASLKNGQYSDDAIYNMGKINELNRQYQAAVKYYRDSFLNYPYANTNVISLMRSANNLLVLRDAPGAITALEKAEKIVNLIDARDSAAAAYEPQTGLAACREGIIYLRGEAYNLAGNYPAALAELERFDSLYPSSSLGKYVKLAKGWALLNSERYAEAISSYDAIIDSSDEESHRLKASAQLYRITALKKMGDLEQARKELSALTVQPTYPYLGQVLLELGQMYYESAEYDMARRTLERADRESSEARVAVRINLLLGATFMETGFWDKAVSEYKKAEQLANNSSEVFMPQKKWYLSEARLKQGICLVESHRSAEAIPSLLAFTGDRKDDPRMDEALFWLAEAYYRTDLLKNAVDIYKEITESHPSSKRREESLYGLGWSYFRQKDFSKSSKVFDQMIKEFPGSNFAVEVLTRQGDGYYLGKNYKSAADCYRRAAKLAPGTEEGQYSSYQLSHALYRMGDNEKSITSLLDFVRVYPRSSYAPNALYLIGWIRFQQRKYGEAIENYNLLISAYAKSGLVARAHYAIGDAYYNEGNYDAAVNSYKKVVELYPSSDLAPEALKSIQYCYMALGKEDEAIKIATNFIETNPSSPFAEEFRFKKAEMFYTGRKYQDAVTEYEKFRQTHPASQKNPEVLYWMGKSYINMNEPEKARATFNTLTKEYRQSDYAPLGLLEIGLMLKEKTDVAGADSVFSLIQEKYPKNQTTAQAGFERAMIKIGIGDTLSGINFYKFVADSFPESDYGDQSRYRIAMYYRSKGMNDQARSNFEMLAKVEDNSTIAAESQYRIGELWMRDEKWDKARDAFIRVKEKFSGVEDWYSLALLNLGETYEMMEQAATAEEIYQTLQAWRPDDEFGKTAKSRLKRMKEK